MSSTPKLEPTVGRPREVRLVAVLDALIAVTDKEAGRLRGIIDSDQTSPEERFQALIEFARLTNSIVSLLA